MKGEINKENSLQFPSVQGLGKNKRQTPANNPQSAQAPSSPTEGMEGATGLGQSLAIKIFPIRALSCPIRIVNEGSVGRVALCSCPAQPALGNCYFSQVINPIIPHLSVLPSFQGKTRRGGRREGDNRFSPATEGRGRVSLRSILSPGSMGF